eukprot:7091071-Prymnesium_polylepis.1
MAPVRRAGLEVSLKSELTIRRDCETLTRARSAEKYRHTHPLPTPPRVRETCTTHPPYVPTSRARSAKLGGNVVKNPNPGFGSSTGYVGLGRTN